MINFAVMNVEGRDMIYLSIIPLDDKTARLSEINGEINAESVFSKLGKYIGFSDFPTPEEIKVYYGFYKGRKYKITQIQSYSFSHCRSIKTIYIGPDINLIDWNMYQCVSLENIIVDPNNGVYMDKSGVLFKGNELIAFPQGRTGHYDVPYGTSRIGNHAFKSCKLNSVSFPETLTEIGINAFYSCKGIKEFVLPNSIKKVYQNSNQGNQPISQKFYVGSDVNKDNPLSIMDIIKMFPA